MKTLDYFLCIFIILIAIFVSIEYQKTQTQILELQIKIEYFELMQYESYDKITYKNK